MKVYMIDYEIKSESDSDYSALWSELKKLNAVCILSSKWRLYDDDSSNCSKIRDHFRQFLGANDRLCVTEIISLATHNLEQFPSLPEDWHWY